jgi:hypothetical protein
MKEMYINGPFLRDLAWRCQNVATHLPLVKRIMQQVAFQHYVRTFDCYALRLRGATELQ